MYTRKNKSYIDKKSIAGIIHVLLFHSYAVFFFAVVFGVVIDQIFPIHIFPQFDSLYQYMGFGMIILGSIIIYWAQTATHYKKEENEKERDTNFFLKGPYKYTRNPTNFGLTVMSLGLGFLINSFFSVILIIVTYIISRIFFIRKQDLILEERYGEVFKEYKKKVKNWI